MKPYTKKFIQLFLLAAALLFLLSPFMIDLERFDKGKIADLTLRGLARALDRYQQDVGRYPETLAELLENRAGDAAWKGPYLKRKELPRDPWGNAYRYEPVEEGAAFRLSSLGADGRTGGSGEAADREWKETGGNKVP